MKKGKAKDVGKVIDLWNHVCFEVICISPLRADPPLLQHFFHPRRIEVVLMRGMTRLSGLDKHPGSPQVSTPGWPGNTSTPPTIESSSNKGKGKDEEDTTYRLFIMPLSLHK